MKKLITLFAIALWTLSVVEMSAQNYYYAVMIGDTVQLSVTNANGTIQWQQTDDTLGTWANISGATTSPYIHLTESSATGKKFYRAEITNLTVCATGSWYSSIIKHKIISSTIDLQIGDFYGGGLVFYNNAGSGLVAAPSDQSTGAQWGCQGIAISGADGTAIGTGEQNTIDIEAGCVTAGTAADICANLILNGYSDWFLPSIDELFAIYNNLKLNNYGNIATAIYKSSTEDGIDGNRGQRMHDGTSGYDYKNDFNYVRAARSFSPPPILSVQARINGGETPKQIYDSGVPLDSLYGKTYQGGLICYLNIADGTGLVVAPSDQSTGAQWGCSGTAITGTSTAISSGMANTNAIVAGCAEASIAAKICANLTLNSYSDWFLPSKDELYILYTNLHLNGFGGFAYSYYWSSSEYAGTEADFVWEQDFSVGSQGSNYKYNMDYVRAVRAF